MSNTVVRESLPPFLASKFPSVDPLRRESEAQFRELMAHLQQAYWIKNAADTAVLYVSPAYEQIWGRTRASLYEGAPGFFESTHPDDQGRLASAMDQKWETDGYAEEFRIVRPDGTVRWIWARTYPVRDEQGEVKRYAGIAEDITERKWAEEEQSRLAAIIEYTEDAIVSITLGGIIIAWNQGAERKYGYTAAEIMGHHIKVLIPPEQTEEYQAVISRARKGEPIAAYETMRRHKDGTLVNLSIRIAPIEARDGEIVGVSKIGHDMGRVRKLEAQLIEAQKMEVIGQLTGGVAHDFNNVLGVILCYSELIMQELGANHPLCESLLGIQRAAERGAGLTRQLLIFSRKETVQFAVLNLNEVLEHTRCMLRQLVDDNIELTFGPPALHGEFKADAGYVGQVLMNLVVNARDAMPGGGKLVITTTNVTLDEAYAAQHPGVIAGEYVRLSVSDTGIGLSDMTKAHLFEPFFTTKPKGKGTGLGLATCHSIVQKCGGNIGVISELGKGATFHVNFPCASRPTGVVAAKPLPAGPLPRGAETLLVVEDDSDVRHLVCGVLRSQGYRVLAAANGEDGRRAILNNQGPAIRLVISDVIMPRMGGQSLAEVLKVENPEVKVLFTSGYTDDAIAHHGVLDPDIAFLPKPYSIVALATRVRELLDEPQQCKAHRVY